LKILAIDTTGAELSLAVRCDGKILAFARELATPHDETLLPQLRRLMGKAGLVWSDLDAVAAASGPGRFTGIRIGMAFAAVLARRLRIPAFAISRLEALAVRTPGTLVCAALPGWRDETFYQLFRRGRQGAVRPAAAPVWADAPQWEKARRNLAGRGAVVSQAAVRAQDMLACVAPLMKRRRAPRFEPLYLKPASYELKNKAGAAR